MNLADLPKQYDPKDAQERWYAFWLEKGYFHADAASQKPPFSIVIPPPNVTGALHLGHALNNTLQDVLSRWRRMQGRDVLWMPGSDHAGIATQAVVEKRLLEEEGKTRHDLGRAALTERIWAWKDQYEKRILGQLRLMGCSCDWERTRFTLDEMCSRAVRRTFFNLFRDGMIIRGKRLVNWDVQLRTAVADDEIYYEEVDGSLWTIRYPVVGAEGVFLQVATTRPETMLGDTAVAVHPEDERYRAYIGREVEIPLTGRKAPIVADPVLVDPSFGTGVVKVTPAHDPNDYQAGLRNGLPMINLMNPDGTYNESAGKYAGLPRQVVRKKVVADLEAAGALEKTTPYKVRLNFSDRSKTPIEPYLSDQWFVRMGDLEDGVPGFAQRAMDAVTSGRVAIHPERYARSYLDWLAEKRDWCISRQLWWGHRIPIWHTLPCPAETLARAFAGRDDVCYRPAENGGWLICALEDLRGDELGQVRMEQDPDVLDTWFSSALWTHSTFGWPDQTPELAKYYPTSVLSTARDIITLWVARMVIFGLYNLNDVPFRDVYIHPVIQDGQGRRMSKSLGNGVDPADIIELHGADALRYTLAAGATETQDLRMPVVPHKLPDGRVINTSDRFEQGRNFANKFWNAARFTLSNMGDYTPHALDRASLPIEDRWILHGLEETIAAATTELEHYQFADASKRLRDFIWGDFCDGYVEFVKNRLKDPADRPRTQAVLAHLLDQLCRLLHPIMPFVTEQVWQALAGIAPERGLEAPEPPPESVCIAPWPVPSGWTDAAARRTVDLWREVIRSVRNIRAERDLPRDAAIAPVLVARGEARQALEGGKALIQGLLGTADLTVVEEYARPAGSAVVVLPDVEIIVPLAAFIDPSVERAKHEKTLVDLEKQIAGCRAKLDNPSFASRAPANVVAETRGKLQELEQRREAVQALLAELA